MNERVWTLLIWQTQNSECNLDMVEARKVRRLPFVLRSSWWFQVTHKCGHWANRREGWRIIVCYIWTVWCNISRLFGGLTEIMVELVNKLISSKTMATLYFIRNSLARAFTIKPKHSTRSPVTTRLKFSNRAKYLSLHYVFGTISINQSLSFNKPNYAKCTQAVTAAARVRYLRLELVWCYI